MGQNAILDRAVDWTLTLALLAGTALPPGTAFSADPDPVLPTNPGASTIPTPGFAPAPKQLERLPAVVTPPLANRITPLVPQDAAAGKPQSPSAASEGTANPVNAAPANGLTGAVATTAARDPLLENLDAAIQATSQRYLTANVHTPWQIFHGILALRQDFKLKLGDDKVSAIDWISTANPKFSGTPWIATTPHGGKFQPYNGRPMVFEGHPSQFLALLSESDLPVTHTFSTGQGTITIADMLQTTMAEVNDREEITWVLWSLNHYFKPDAAWTNAAGEAWSMERLVSIQNAAAVENGACGGNHGLFAITRARQKFLSTGRPLRGRWLESDQKIKRYMEIARSLQNSDGSFSADFYKGPKISNDLNSRLNTTGHTLEFLSIALADDQLDAPWVRNAVMALSTDLVVHRKKPADCGPLYHSLNALKIYQARVLQKQALVQGSRVMPVVELRTAESLARLGPDVADPALSAAPRPLEIPSSVRGELAVGQPIPMPERDANSPTSALMPVNR